MQDQTKTRLMSVVESILMTCKDMGVYATISCMHHDQVPFKETLDNNLAHTATTADCSGPSNNHDY